ncbi:MAG: DUF433 domain-containing protein [FCB group bacterium]|nr:DUF433 domain-containing protein [FCB group bacterium]
MDEWLKIRDTDISILDILKLLGKGFSNEQIVEKYPQINYQDIKYAAKMAHDFIVKHLIYDALYDVYNRIDSMLDKRFYQPNENYLKSPESWTKDEEEELIQLYQYRADIKDISQILLRSPQDIEQQLKKLGV